jgi:hypothetical protein
MPHHKLREDKTCLNCGHAVEERYCTHCGQENVQLRDSSIHLVIHYVQDLFHYEGKFWHTLKNLFTRPGYVPDEYLSGKRKQNLDPVRFYVFTSTVFFVLLYSIVNSDKMVTPADPRYNFSKRLFNLNQEKEFITGSADTSYINLLIEKVEAIADSLDSLENDTTRSQFQFDIFNESDTVTVDDTWLDKAVKQSSANRKKEMETRYGGDELQAVSVFIDELIHKTPQLLFLSLPFFALFLKLLYFRSSRKLYVDHLVFSVYHYSYVYVLLSTVILLNMATYKITNTVFTTITSWGLTILVLYLFYYLFISMKRFYKDRLLKLIIRYGLLMVFMFFTILILFIVLGLVTYLWG